MAGTRRREPVRGAYRSVRDFRRAPAPSGRGGAPAFLPDRNPIFVIREHDAGGLHYDLSLEVDGVLASWRVPQGPSTDPRSRRLAVRAGDGPLDGVGFEGAASAGGGDTVIVWDAGPYRNLRHGDDGGERAMADALAEGLVEVWLEGRKLRGGYALVRTRTGGDPRHWSLVKLDDEGADARRNPVRTQRRSVLSGRTLAKVAERRRPAPPRAG